MAEKLKKEKKSKVNNAAKTSEKEAKIKKAKKQAVATAFSLLADEKTVDPALSSLFSAPAPTVPKVIAAAKKDDGEVQIAEVAGAESDEPADDHGKGEVADPEPNEQPNQDQAVRRKRKRKDADEELEDAYMQRLAREEEKDEERAAAERAGKRQKVAPLAQGSKDLDEGGDHTSLEDGEQDGDESLSDGVNVEDDDDAEDDVASPPPKHETQEAADVELSKANRTVFLGNVSTSAISSKSARKTLVNHLGSFFAELPAPKDGETKHKLESIRFRSTPYASAVPKKAAYARKELMDATTKSTNAYVVYSSSPLAREAAKRLNGTVVLDRHLRVDEIAHPAKVDNKRCVFVGNLGFVDDETNIQDANEEEGREKRKRGKEPADVEEGLWRTFGKCGTVESVRVIRDSTTRVGKGIAYVQFADENGVEAALLYDEKKFPPMLPRKLRVSRARAQKNAKPGSGRPSAARPSTNGGYQRKITGAEASQMGRAGKLYGRAAASKLKQPRRVESKTGPLKSGPNAAPLGDGIKAPEAFVFEGHRASSKSGKSGLKLGGKKGGGKGKPTNRSAKRGAAYKAGGKKKAT